MKRLIASVVLYAGSTLGSFIVTGLLHVASARGLWGIFPNADRVRQVSVYLLDVIPFFLVAFVAAAFITLRLSRHGRNHEAGPTVVAIAASVGAIALHSWFFASDARGFVFLLLFAVVFACLYSIGGWILFGWLRPLRSFVAFPRPRHAGLAFMSLILISVGYVGMFRTGIIPGYGPETETLRADLQVTPPELLYSTANNDPLRTGLFTKEDLPFGAGPTRFADIDGDGWIDIVLRRGNATLELWRNDRGTFVRDVNFLSGIENADIGDFYIADYDGDGRNDIVFVRMVRPQPSEFHNTFIKKLFWYFGDDPQGHLTLVRQLPSGRWQDVTLDAFPGGVPKIFQKIEPVLWLDANHDGRLDFVFSQYPNGRHTLNKLFIQDENGRFHDRMDEMLKGTAPLIYSEGSDVGDYDGDGRIDFFAYGYLFRNMGNTYNAQCGENLTGYICAAYGRLDEAGLFEDLDGDGAMDLVISYHGPGGGLPKYYMQIYRGDPQVPGRLNLDTRYGNLYYGMDTYMRAKDFNLDGLPDILTDAPSRLLSFDKDGRWLDLLPAITGMKSGSMLTGGWIDVDDDGDWDIVMMSLDDGRAFLLRNNLNPKNILRIAALGEGGIENQPGATIRLSADGRTMVQSYRPMAGYAATTDPRIVMPFEPGVVYTLSACFPSLSGAPNLQIQDADVSLVVQSVSGTCVDYHISIASSVDRVDLTLVAGPTGTSVRVKR